MKNNWVITVIIHSYNELNQYIMGKVLLVCDDSIFFLKINDYLKDKNNIIRFSEFVPNPLYESVVKGVDIFHQENCDTILAVGGGSAIDVAKCIKLFSNMDPGENYLLQSIIPNQIPLIAVPTTAGTGSEATQYAVVYFDGEKQSVSHYSCIPSVVLFDTSVLDTLPLYQKKCTMMDALCHSIESYWSVNSNETSKKYSESAIRIIMNNWEAYISGDNSRNELMLQASNIAGKAINITQTTAGHAMSYKLTSLYGIAHGHAVSLCVSRIWPFMVEHMDSCIDKRGKDYLYDIFMQIAHAMECNSVRQSILKFQSMICRLGLVAPSVVNVEEYEILKESVNQARLKNNPVALNKDYIEQIYYQILD